jgi:hypothetical protein
MKPLVTHERLKELLSYDPETGVFTWNVRRRNQVTAGDDAGSLLNRGYTRIMIDGKRYTRSRLAWLYVHGVWPKEFIDHKNGNRADDRLSNLREATRAENNRNSRRPPNSSSGLRGVTWRKDSKLWEARIRNGERRIFLGRFKTGEEAHKAYCEAAYKLHGEFARIDAALKGTP